MRIAIKGGIATAIGNTALMAANLGRDICISRVLGVSVFADAVFLALSLPVFVVTVATLSFRNASLPFVERVQQSHGKPLAAACVAHLLLLALLGFVLLAILMALSAPFVANWLSAPASALSTAVTVRTLILCLPMFIVSAAALLLEGPLQANGAFLAPALLKALMPVGFAAGMLIEADDDPITGALIGGHLGAVIQCLWTALLVRRAGLSAPVHLRLQHPELHPFRVQYGYLVLAGGIAYLNPVINQWMVTPLGTGAVSTLSYATRLSTGVSTLVISSITPALLAQFSRFAAQGNLKQLSSSYKKACLMLSLVSGAAVVGTWVLAEPVVRLLYGGQAMGLEETQAIAHFLAISIIHLVPLALGICAATMLSATSQNRLFAPVGALLVAVNVAGNLVFIRWLGLTGMAISTIVMYCCSMVLMNVFLIRKRIVVLKGS